MDRTDFLTARIKAVHDLLKLPSTKRLARTCLRDLVGKELLARAEKDFARAKQVRLISFVDDPMMNESQAARWKAIKRPFAEAIKASRTESVKRRKETMADLTTQLMLIDELPEADRAFFYSDDIEGRLVVQDSYDARSVVRLYRQGIIEPEWVREAPKFQQREALAEAYRRRTASSAMTADEGAPEGSAGAN